MTAVVDSTRLWERKAACGSDPELWHAVSTRIAWARIGVARHICLTHCPVREQCAANIPPMRSTVVAGVFYNTRGRQSEYQPLARRCDRCPTWRRA